MPKTEAGNRRIPMMQQVYDVLQEEYERQKQEGFCVENVDGMTNFVFTNRFGMPHNPAAVNRAIKRIVDTHNSEEEVAAKKEKREPVMIPRFSCHIFRHTFASRFCENETNIKVIQEVMGHADVSTTMNIYAEANPDVTKSVIEKLSKNMDIFQKRVLRLNSLKIENIPIHTEINMLYSSSIVVFDTAVHVLK